MIKIIAIIHTLFSYYFHFFHYVEKKTKKMITRFADVGLISYTYDIISHWYYTPWQWPSSSPWWYHRAESWYHRYVYDIIGLWYHRQFKAYDIKCNINDLWYHIWYPSRTSIAQPSSLHEHQQDGVYIRQHTATYEIVTYIQ